MKQNITHCDLCGEDLDLDSAIEMKSFNRLNLPITLLVHNECYDLNK